MVSDGEATDDQHVTHSDANRIALVGFGAVLFVMLVVAFTNLAFAPPHLATPGFALPAGETVAAAPAEKPKEETPLPVLLASADPAKGQQAAKVCTSCHAFEKGGAAKVGPPLWGVVGRPIASVPGFAYSDSLKAVGGDWTFDHLNVMIRKPKEEAAGTKMAFPGESDAKKRADILAFLRTLSDSPVALPEAK